MIIYGIDPGLAGGIAILDTDAPQKPVAYPMPIYKHGTRKHLDKDTVSKLVAHGIGTGARFVIEAQRPTSGKIASFSVGHQGGFLEGLIFGRAIMEVVAPITWQKLLGINGPTKAGSIELVQRMFPEINLRRTPACKKSHDGMADALCLAEYGRRIWGGS